MTALDTTISAGTRVRIHAPFQSTRWMHGLTGTVTSPATRFTGNGWTDDGDLYQVRLDDGDNEVIDVFTSMLVQMSGDSGDDGDPQGEDDDEFECDDECCRGPLDGRDAR